MQKEIKKVDNLLKADGTLKNVGYSKKVLLKYNKEDIKKTGRIKEWDYYMVADQKFALCLTVTNLSYAAAISASVVDLGDLRHYDKTCIIFFPKDKKFMPETSLKGKTSLTTKKGNFTFSVEGETRHLMGNFNGFYVKKKGPESDLNFDITLIDDGGDSLVKATPFKNKQHFYFNHKKNCMIAKGTFTFKGKTYQFDEGSALGLLDWGRGVLPYKTQWYWANMQARHNGHLIGFNLGRALGKDDDACENMIFLDKVGHKVEDVDIYVRKSALKYDYMKPWTFYSKDGRVELMFEPLIDRYAPFNALVLQFIPHQVFGRYSGKLVLDGGEEITIENIPGFAERVVNRW